MLSVTRPASKSFSSVLEGYIKTFIYFGLENIFDVLGVNTEWGGMSECDLRQVK